MTYPAPSTAHIAARGVKNLTTRDIQILAMAAESLSSSDTAYILKISQKNVEAHRKKISDILGVQPGTHHKGHNRIKDAIKIARREGLIPTV